MVRTQHSSFGRYDNDGREHDYDERAGHKAFVLLSKLDLSYPGWNVDFQAAMKAYTEGSSIRFEAGYRKLKEKQLIYDDCRSLDRLNAMVKLNLTYPGNDQDLEDLEEWHLKNRPSESNEEIFRDKLDGLKNKQKLFIGDRSHPHIVELDNLDLSYPNWEEDYQAAFVAHTGAPSATFPRAMHRLREKQRVYLGDRSHWRLRELDNLNLTYPGWQEDVKEIEMWHFANEETLANGQMFHEALEGMRDQEQICQTLDYCPSDDSSLSSGPSAKLETKVIPTRVNMKKQYDSITESLMEHQRRREKLLKQRVKTTWKTRPDNRAVRSSQREEEFEQREDTPSLLDRDETPDSRDSSLSGHREGFDSNVSKSASHGRENDHPGRDLFQTNRFDGTSSPSKIDTPGTTWNHEDALDGGASRQESFVSATTLNMGSSSRRERSVLQTTQPVSLTSRREEVAPLTTQQIGPSSARGKSLAKPAPSVRSDNRKGASNHSERHVLPPKTSITSFLRRERKFQPSTNRMGPSRLNSFIRGERAVQVSIQDVNPSALSERSLLQTKPSASSISQGGKESPETTTSAATSIRSTTMTSVNSSTRRERSIPREEMRSSSRRERSVPPERKGEKSFSSRRERSLSPSATFQTRSRRGERSILSATNNKNTTTRPETNYEATNELENSSCCQSPIPRPPTASFELTMSATNAENKTAVNIDDPECRSITSSNYEFSCDNSVKSSTSAPIGKCAVCHRRPTTHVFVPCGHFCACAICSDKVLNNTGACPICNEAAHETHRVLIP